MPLVLKHFDTELLKFESTVDIRHPEIKILWMNEDAKQLFPIDLTVSGEGVFSWLKHRLIPSNRNYVHNFLAKLGLNEKDIIGIIKISYGLSLNDSYWICPETEKRKFSEINLYENRFSQILSLIAFTGNGSYVKSNFRSSPEFTTNGMLAKGWRKLKNQIYLYKSGTEGAANSGKEPYSEFYAYQVAEKMGINAIEYGLSKWKGKLCSTCKIFTSKDLSFVPIGRIVKDGGIEAVEKFYKDMGPDFYDSFVDMIVFDAIIYNQDRHFGNFGVLIESLTNKIIAPAPIFDNGLSLYCYAMESDFENIDKYKKTILPATYDDFIGYAKKLITECQKKMLRKLINFKFKKHSRYNLPPDRLRFIEVEIQKNVEMLLK